ncbi:MAG: hypothetical protein GTO03_17180 [Planctomycetales bacterium]|nr:hypothetical protein [Planctomycetales bacterium]
MIILGSGDYDTRIHFPKKRLQPTALVRQKGFSVSAEKGREVDEDAMVDFWSSLVSAPAGGVNRSPAGGR